MPKAVTEAERERLEVRDLRIELTSARSDVVSDVSFSVHEGEMLGLVGESGSGKTTVALALLGHTRRGLVVTSGEVNLDGVNILGLRSAELRAVRGARVAYVPQDPAAALNPALRIGVQLREAITSHPGIAADPDARAREVLDDVRLAIGSGILTRYPHQLSGGQQQRVAIAMAFACRPSLIVLDEPTTGLDVSTQRHVIDTVRSMCRSYGVAAVYVSHDLAVVSGLVSQVAVMYAGRIVEIGPIGQVFSSPVHPYSRGLLAAVPSVDRAETLSGIEGQPPQPGMRPKGCSFAPRCSYAIGRCAVETPGPISFEQRTVRCLRAIELKRDSHVRERIPVTPLLIRGSEILDVRDLSASYGRHLVLDDVSLKVEPESCLAVVGESGSGKTTLARCIAGLHSHWTGQISFDAADLPARAKQRPKNTLKRIQYIFQNPYTSLNPRKTVDQIISQPLEHFYDLSERERAAKVAQVLDDVSLGSDILRRYPDQLSGGERQRIAIARAIAVQPDLLICDEVTSALDVSVQAVIIELLRRLQRERRLAMIFITHNLALVRSIAQTAIVLREGHLVETGRVEDLMSHPQDGYTLDLINDVPKLATTASGDFQPFAP